MGDKKTVNVEGDRLSSLPDDLIHKMLSFVSIKCASVLSPRWRFIWTSMPYLSFSSNDFRTLPKFSNTVKHVFFPVEIIKSKCFLSISPFVESSRSLKHLSLTGYSSYHCIMTPPTWELPTLATLNLHRVKLHDNGASLFNHCANLKNLTLKNCNMMGLGTSTLSICLPGLSNLTFEDGWKDINVVTPQLKNLTIKHWRGILLISAPNLSSLHYKDLRYIKCFYGNEDGDYDDPFQFSTDLLYWRRRTYVSIVPLKIRLLLIKLFLLTSSVQLISHQPSLFTNLKSLKIYPVDVTQSKVTMSDDVKNYLLDNSPDVILTMVSHEVCTHEVHFYLYLIYILLNMF
ncbi:putative leucine-rich repeat domain superfamily [Helianthus anomalus]